MKRTLIILYGLLVLCLAAAAVRFPEVHADNEDYGVKAYEYVRYLNDHFPQRINNHEITGDKTRLLETRQWIVSEMAGFGYNNPEYWYGENLGDEYATVTFHKAGKSEKTIMIGAHYDCVDTKGAEDNGTGVGMVLELADRFKDVETNLSIDFCFYDGEEFLQMAGSYRVLADLRDYNPARYQNILIGINLDSIGSGDRLHVYGGKYGEDGVLYQSWGYNMAMTIAADLGVELHEMPAGIEQYIPPTRSNASDHQYFYMQDLPYMYFEANAWLKPDGSVGNPEKPYNYNSALECFSDTNGRIIHTKYDDLDVLEELVPGRIAAHLRDCARVVSAIIREMDESSPEKYAHYRSEQEIRESLDAETAEESTETTEESTETTEEPEETTEEPAETSREDTETTEEETESTADGTAEETPETSPDTSAETLPGSAQSAEEASSPAEEENTPESTAMAPETEETAAPKDTKSDTAKWLYIGGCSLAAIVLIALSVVFSRRKNRSYGNDS